VIHDVPRPRPPYLIREITRHGHPVWYVRVGRGKRIRIRPEYGTPEFSLAYEAALRGESTVAPQDTFRAATLGWLIERYRESAAWSQLSSATRRQREGILRAVTETAGRETLTRIDRRAIEKGIERRNDRAHAARHFLQTMRGLFRWALQAQHVGADATAGLAAIRPRTDGHHTWTLAECEKFEARWPRGTRERLAFDLLLYTGLRRGDAVRLGRPHVRNGEATIRTEKTGTVVTLPILPPLEASIEAGPVGELTFICGERGQPLKKESFGNWFGAVCRKTGVPGTAHGLRKCGATRAADNGATDAQLEAMFGWARGSKEAAVYTRNANRVKLARAGAPLLIAEREVNIYSRTLPEGAGASAKSRRNSKR
jgi:integrase